MWLFSLVILHSVIANIKSGVLLKWVFILVLSSFSMMLFSFFIVRSGLLTSVHSFSSDPTRGVFLLIIFLFFSICSVFIYANRKLNFQVKNISNFKSREALISYNNLIIIAAIFIILWGLLYIQFFIRFYLKKVFLLVKDFLIIAFHFYYFLYCCFLL